MLEFRLAGDGIRRVMRQRVHAQSGHVGAAPVHRQEGLAGPEPLVRPRRQHDAATPRLEPGQRAGRESEPAHVLGMQRHPGLIHMLRQHAGERGARQRVPMVAQPPRGQLERVVRRHGFDGRPVAQVMETGAPVRRGIASIAIQARPALPRAIRPLLRTVALQRRVVQRAVVQIPARRHPGVLGVHLAFIAIAEQRGLARRDAGRQPERDRLRQPPVGHGVARRRDGGPHAADAALGIGHGAGFLRPGRGGQHQVGMGQRLSAGIGFLHDHEIRARQSGARAGLVGHGLGRIGGGDPQHLDAAFARALEQLQRAGAGRFGQGVHAP